MSIGVGGIYVEIKGDKTGLDSALTSAKLSTATAATAMNKNTTSISAGFKSMIASINPAAIAVAGFAAATAAVGIAVREAIQTGMEFETSMKTVQAVSGATAQQYRSMEAAAREMGATTEFSAGQSADALKFLSMAGLEVSASIEALPGMLDLATAAQMDLGTASDIVTDTLSAFGMKTSELSRLSDAFINTSTKSNTTVRMLGESFKYVAPIAAQMGYDVEQTAGYLGIMANAGIKASDAGTDLRQVLLRTSKAAVALGMDVESSLNDVLKEMYSRQMSANEVTELFGMIASKTAMVLMNNVSAVEKLTSKLKDGEGATKKLAATMRDTLSNDLKTMSSAASEASIEMFSMFSAELRGLITAFTDAIKNSSVEVEVFGRGISGTITLMEKFVRVYEYLNDLPGSWQLTKWIIEAQDKWKQSVDAFSEDAKRLDDEARGIFTFPMPSNSWVLMKEGLNAISEFENKLIDIDSQSRASWYSIEQSMQTSTDAMKEANVKMYDSLGFESDQYYDYKAQIYRDDYLKYIGLTGDVENAQKLLNSRMKELDQDLFNFRDQKNSEYVDSVAVSIQKEIDDRVSANGGIEKSFADTWYEIEQTQMKGTESAIKNFEKERAAAEKLSEKRAQYTNDMYNSIELKGQEAYDYSIKLLNAQESEYAKYINDVVLLATWRADREKEINNQLLLETGSFFDGVKLGYQDLLENQITWAEAGQGVFEAFAQNGRNAFSNTLFSALKGDMSDIGDIWDSFMDSMLHKLTDTVAEMAIQWGVNAIGGVTGWWDTGAWEIKKDHVAMVHKGEMIVPADVASVVRGGAGSDSVSDLGQISPSGGNEWGGDDAAAIGGFLSGTGKAYASMAAQGLSLAAQGKISMSDFAMGMLSPQNAVGVAMTGGIQGAITESLGLTGGWAKAGGILGSMIGSVTFGGLSSGVTGSFGAMVGNALGDALNAREMESMRDMYENALGYVAANKAFASFVEGMDESGYATDGMTGWGGFEGLGIGNPGSYGGSNDYGGAGGYGQDDGTGTNSTGPGAGQNGSGGGESSDSGGGSNDSGPGAGQNGYASGGIIDRLMVPGEDGLAAMQFGEGVISKRGMKALDTINNGIAGGLGDSVINELVSLNKKMVRLLRKFDDEGILTRV